MLKFLVCLTIFIKPRIFLSRCPELIPLGELGEILLKKGRAGISDLALSLGVPQQLVLRALSGLRGIEWLSADGDVVVGDRLELVLSLVEKGVDPSRLSRFLDWRVFEEHTARLLEANGFVVVRDLRLYKPRRVQVDVIGHRHGEAIVVDCKHWSPSSTVPSRLKDAAIRHVERTRVLAGSSRFHTMVKGSLLIKKNVANINVFPIIVTLSNKIKGVFFGVTVVPISLLNSFLRDFDEHKHDLPHLTLSV